MNDEISKTVPVTLDKQSIDILKKVDPIHRESVINIGIAMVSKTQYYKTITGDITDNLMSISDIGVKSAPDTPVVDTPKSVVKPKPSTSATWDNF